MDTRIIACKTIENELLAAMKRLENPLEIRWVESGLHNIPKQLNAHLQTLLDDCKDCRTVLLAMSFCGNALVGLRTGDFRLVVPRCDDCITLLLGSMQKRQSIQATYFLTEGWLKGERNLWREYEYCLEKYGPKRAEKIFSVMMAHYKNLAMLDTGCFDTLQCSQEIQRIAQVLNLEYTRIPGTLDYLDQLLQGDWPFSRFLIVPPHSCITHEDCTLPDAAQGSSCQAL